MKAFERAITGEVDDVSMGLITLLEKAGVYIQIQVADDEDEHVETLTENWGLPENYFGRTMDNNEGREERFSSNGYFFNVPGNLLRLLEKYTGTSEHRLLSQEDDLWRVAGLSTCLGVLYKKRDFKVVPISSKRSARRERMAEALKALPVMIPFWDNMKDAAFRAFDVKPSAERKHPRAR